MTKSIKDSIIDYMVSILLKVGQFLRILDEQGQISLTNLGMYVALYKLITTAGSFADVGAFFTAAAVYSIKKSLNA